MVGSATRIMATSPGSFAHPLNRMVFIVNQPLVQRAFVTGEEISDIVLQIEPILYDVPRSHGIVVLISMALILQYPLITPEELHDGVRQVSEFMCLLLPDETEKVGSGNEGLMN